MARYVATAAFWLAVFCAICFYTVVVVGGVDGGGGEEGGGVPEVRLQVGSAGQAAEAVPPLRSLACA